MNTFQVKWGWWLSSGGNNIGSSNYNLFYTNNPGGSNWNLQWWKNTYGFDRNSIEADPLFMDYANDDFRLKANSPAFSLGFEQIDLSNVGPRRERPEEPQPEPQPEPEPEPEPGLLYGDVSGNGKVTSYDASLVAQYAVGKIELSPEQIKAADVSGNGTVSSYDASLIAQYVVGLIDKFPVEG